MGRPLIADLTGRRFGRLTATAHLGKGRWTVRCDCGSEYDIAGGSLRNGDAQSCGCLRSIVLSRVVSERERTHGRSRTPEYNSWWNMVRRCTDPTHNRFQFYGTLGVRVCERWQSFENFLADMGEKPGPKHSIDRYPDADGNYEPGNCRWATPQQQRRNRRDYLAAHPPARLI
jgi:hypothetical protein